MKRNIYIFILILAISLSPMVCLGKENILEINTQYVNYEIPEPKAHSIEETYQDIIMTLLAPHIIREVEKYYGKDAEIDLFSIKVLEAKRTVEHRGFKFKLKIQVDPFIGPHNTIGVDNLTFIIQPSGVKLEKFEHIKSLIEIPKI